MNLSHSLIELTSRITFFVFLALLVWYLLYQRNKQRLEESLLRTMRVLSQSFQLGEGLETSLKKASEIRTEPSHVIFLDILRWTERGKSISESLDMAAKKRKLFLLEYLVPLLKEAETSSSRIDVILDEFTEKAGYLREKGKSVKAQTDSNLFIMKLIGVVILPAVFALAPLLFDTFTVSMYLSFFMIGSAAILALADLVVYSSFTKSLLQLPMFVSLSYLITGLLPTLVHSGGSP